MKKFVALLLALMLCLGSFPAFADVDFSAYTQEELFALRDLINKELLKRGIEKAVEVPPGIYIVGEDIPAGIYTLRPEPIKNAYSTIEVYLNESKIDYSFYFFNEFLSANDNDYIGKLELSNGNIVIIENGKMIFAPYQGLGF